MIDTKKYKIIDRNIKVGSLVGIVDGSYMVNFHPKDNRTTEDGKMVGLNKDAWVVLEINGNFPTDRGRNPHILTPNNNCLIENTKTHEKFYCSNVNIKPIKPI